MQSDSWASGQAAVIRDDDLSSYVVYLVVLVDIASWFVEGSFVEMI